MLEQIDYSDFQKLTLSIGTVIEATVNTKARKPAYVLKIDFGELGIKTSSAQITENYEVDNLIGLQIIAVMNFPTKRVAGVKSEVLVLAGVSEDKGTVLLTTTKCVANGTLVS